MADTPAKPTLGIARDVSKRWTKKLVKDGFTAVSKFFLENYAQLVPHITNNEAMLIIQLISFKWSEKAPFPSYKTLARRMGMTPASVQNHARNLERKGYLVRTQRIGSTNTFHLEKLFEALELRYDQQQKKQAGQPKRRRSA